MLKVTLQSRRNWCNGGLTENAGRENGGPSKLQGMKLHEIAGHDNAGPKMTTGVKWNAKSILSLFCLKRSTLVCSFVSCYFIPAFSQLSDPLPTTSAVRQGCVLAPVLFCVAIDWILRHMKS